MRDRDEASDTLGWEEGGDSLMVYRWWVCVPCRGKEVPRTHVHVHTSCIHACMRTYTAGRLLQTCHAFLNLCVPTECRVTRYDDLCT